MTKARYKQHIKQAPTLAECASHRRTKTYNTAQITQYKYRDLQTIKDAIASFTKTLLQTRR